VQHRLHWSFEDPAAFQGSEAEKLAKFREVRSQIDAAIKTFITEKRINHGTTGTAES
jgi:arsenate reductase